MLRLVALVFLAAGALILVTSRADPSARVPRVTQRAPLATVEFGEAQKIGRYVTVTLEGVDERYQLGHLGNVAGLEERLQEALRPGVEVALTAVERQERNWATPAGVALPILELRRGGEALVTPETFVTTATRIVRVAAPLAGGLGILFGLALLALSLRLGKA